MWDEEWNFLKVLFVINRYIPFVEVFLNYLRM